MNPTHKLSWAGSTPPLLILRLFSGADFQFFSLKASGCTYEKANWSHIDISIGGIHCTSWYSTRSSLIFSSSSLSLARAILALIDNQSSWEISSTAVGLISGALSYKLSGQDKTVHYTVLKSTSPSQATETRTILPNWTWQNRRLTIPHSTKCLA